MKKQYKNIGALTSLILIVILILSGIALAFMGKMTYTIALFTAFNVIILAILGLILNDEINIDKVKITIKALFGNKKC